MEELSIIQKTYDAIQWYVPMLNTLPRSHKFTLGDRIANALYDLLEGLITAKYSRKKLPLLYSLNIKLEHLRFQTRLLRDFGLLETDRYQHAGRLLFGVGQELGGWIKDRKEREGA